MKKSFMRVAAVFLTILTVAGVLYGCGGTKEPNEGIDTITDKNGITYLAIVDSNDGHTLAGVTDKDGNLYAAETDASGNVLSDGNLYSVSYTGELPTNDTTAVSINESQSSDNYFADNAVVTDSKSTTDASATTAASSQNTAEGTTGKTTDATTKPQNTSAAITAPEKTTAHGKTYLAEKYKTLFQSQTYYVEFYTDDDELTPYPVTMAIKNGNIYMKTKFEGMDCTMLYQKKKDSVYVVLSDYHVYCKVPSSMLDDLDVSDFGDTADVEKVRVSNVIIGERDCISEEYKLKDGSVSTYYFYNEELVRLDQISADGETSIMNITKISSSVDDSLFELPKGYIPVNLSKFDFGGDKNKNGN